jgi:hypothetical protein
LSPLTTRHWKKSAPPRGADGPPSELAEWTIAARPVTYCWIESYWPNVPVSKSPFQRTLPLGAGALGAVGTADVAALAATAEP